jgi:hypothetical protein
VDLSGRNNHFHCDYLGSSAVVADGQSLDAALIVCALGWTRATEPLRWQCSAGTAVPSGDLGTPHACVGVNVSAALEFNGSLLLGSANVSSGEAIPAAQIGVSFDAQTEDAGEQRCPLSGNLVDSEQVDTVQDCKTHCAGLAECNFFFFQAYHALFKTPYCQYFAACGTTETEGNGLGTVYERSPCDTAPATDVYWICPQPGAWNTRVVPIRGRWSSVWNTHRGGRW